MELIISRKEGENQIEITVRKHFRSWIPLGAGGRPEAPVAEGGPVGFLDGGNRRDWFPRGPGAKGGLQRRVKITYLEILSYGPLPSSFGDSSILCFFMSLKSPCREIPISSAVLALLKLDRCKA